uniref:Uncharacterized protein n=1 Tax=Oryza glumipatula TaxID=40148 RepID=A0A0E0BSL8_9ORYZ
MLTGLPRACHVGHECSAATHGAPQSNNDMVPHHPELLEVNLRRLSSGGGGVERPVEWDRGARGVVGHRRWSSWPSTKNCAATAAPSPAPRSLSPFFHHRFAPLATAASKGCDKRRTGGGGGNGVGLRPAAELLPVGLVAAVDLEGGEGRRLRDGDAGREKRSVGCNSVLDFLLDRKCQSSSTTHHAQVTPSIFCPPLYAHDH